MNKIKYSYCLNENNELVHISCVSAETRHSHTFFCLECGQPLIAKIGKIKVPHFGRIVRELGPFVGGQHVLHEEQLARLKDSLKAIVDGEEQHRGIRR